MDGHNELEEDLIPIEEQYEPVSYGGENTDTNSNVQEDPGVELEDDGLLLEDLPEHDQTMEEEVVGDVEPPPIAEDAEVEEPPMLEEIEEDEGQDADEPEIIMKQGPEFSHLDGSYWAMGNQGLPDYCLSIIKDYVNVEATLVTPQYGFEKGLKVFGKKVYKATMEEECNWHAQPIRCYVGNFSNVVGLPYVSQTKMN